uniref:CCDC113/CCDC96 coiled-coil domain-containing protein n=1 Tax=Timema monikensis TaxID=170555 RepID=A0A7R9HQS8_9NEOP|nr:unnamed protein product [Timema monikensis]
MGLDAEQKYNKRLLEYSALKVEEDKEKQEMNQEISKLRGQKEELATELDNQLKALMTRQTEIGLALKNSKTGKLIPPEKRRTYGVELATQYICTCTQMNAMMTAGLAVEERGVASAALVMGRVVIFLTQITRDKITNDSTQSPGVLPCKGKDVEAAGQGGYPLRLGNLRRTAKVTSLRVLRKTSLNIKIVQRLVSRQLNKFKEVGKIRLEYTKLRNHVTAQEELRKSIETFGDDLFLIDYEQLRMENQNFLEKIEERDEELERLRQKATSSIQVLAHVREKADATTSDIHEKVKRLNDTDAEVTFLREQLTSLKRRRDHFRDESQRLRREAGLLTETRLLEDFEESIEEATRLSAQLQNLKNSYSDQQQKLENIRKTIEVIKAKQRLPAVPPVASGFPIKTSKKISTSLPKIPQEKKAILPVSNRKTSFIYKLASNSREYLEFYLPETAGRLPPESSVKPVIW